jgi:hypothetical protein
MKRLGCTDAAVVTETEENRMMDMEVPDAREVMCMATHAMQTPKTAISVPEAEDETLQERRMVGRIDVLLRAKTEANQTAV